MNILLPKTLEALIVHHADIIDGDADKFLKVAGDKGSSIYSPLLKRNIYIRAEEEDSDTE